MSELREAFWRRFSLAELSEAEWEALCDGCAKCCLHKLEDEDSGEIYFTNVHCRLLDTDTGRCTDYARRTQRVPDCVNLTLEELENPTWLPQTCAYRLLAEGKQLPDWHPLLTGDPDSVDAAGMQLCGRTVCETDADDLAQHIVTWIK